MKKRIMILGAGTNQLPLIRTAVQNECYVITLDNLPDNIGHKYSHQYVNCCTLDIEKVTKSAKKLQIDAICTTSSDIAVTTVAHVCEQLGLPGIKLNAAKTISNKGFFRKCQKKHGLNHPPFLDGDCFTELFVNISSINPPLVFKPVDSSGSRGIVCVENINKIKCLSAFNIAQSFSNSKTVCVEEFVDGIEFGGDAFLIDCRIVFCAITQKHLRGVIPMGHSLPSTLSDKEKKQVIGELQKNCAAVGYKNGPLNFDVKINDKGIVVLEMGARTGGNGITSLIKRSMDVDMDIATLQYALGEKVMMPQTLNGMKGCGSLILNSYCSGKLMHISSKKQLCLNVPEIFEYILDYEVGDKVHEFTHSGNQIGRVFFDCSNTSKYHQLIEKINEVLEIEVESDQLPRIHDNP